MLDSSLDYLKGESSVLWWAQSLECVLDSYLNNVRWVHYLIFSYRLRYTSNPSPEKLCWHFKNTIQLVPKLREHIFIENTPGFCENFVYVKKRIFCIFSKILKFDFSLNRLLLTKCWLNDFKSIWNLLLPVTFFIFWIIVVSPIWIMVAFFSWNFMIFDNKIIGVPFCIIVIFDKKS